MDAILDALAGSLIFTQKFERIITALPLDARVPNALSTPTILLVWSGVIKLNSTSFIYSCLFRHLILPGTIALNIFLKKSQQLFLTFFSGPVNCCCLDQHFPGHSVLDCPLKLYLKSLVLGFQVGLKSVLPFQSDFKLFLFKRPFQDGLQVVLGFRLVLKQSLCSKAIFKVSSKSVKASPHCQETFQSIDCLKWHFP